MCKINALFFPRPAMFCLVPPPAPPTFKTRGKQGSSRLLCTVFSSFPPTSVTHSWPLFLCHLSPLLRYLPRRRRARIHLFVAVGVMSRLFFFHSGGALMFCVTVCHAGSCLRGRVFRPWLLLGCLALFLLPGPIDYFSSRP